MTHRGPCQPLRFCDSVNPAGTSTGCDGSRDDTMVSSTAVRGGFANASTLSQPKRAGGFAALCSQTPVSVPPLRAARLSHEEPAEENSFVNFYLNRAPRAALPGSLDDSTSFLLALPSSRPPPTHLLSWNQKRQLYKTAAVRTGLRFASTAACLLCLPEPQR